MRSVSRNLFRILNNDRFMPVTLVDIRLPGVSDSSAIRMTDAGNTVTFDGNTFSPVSMSRGLHSEILSAESNGQPSLTLTVQNIDLQMATILNNVEIEGAEATVWITDRRLVRDPLLTDARDVIVAAKGEVRNPQINENNFLCEVTNILGIMDSIRIPRRVYQPKCNYAFGSRACGVDITAAPHSITFATQAGTNKYEIVAPSSVVTNAGGDDLTDFYKNGYVIATSGPAILQARPIHRVVSDGGTGARIFVTHPFLISPHSGNILLRRGCPKTPEGCADRQADGTAKKFGGFWDLPHGRIKPRSLYYTDIDPAWGGGYI
jgi:hypothetical protein